MVKFAHDQYEGDRLTQIALKFILYTFVRTSELRFAVWDEIDLDGISPIWKIPSERMKMNRPHYVPLVRQTVELLGEVKALTDGKDLIFPSQKNIRNINCFSNEGNKWRDSIMKFEENILKIDFREEFSFRRGRVNCSLKDENIWRWLGIQMSIEVD